MENLKMLFCGGGGDQVVIKVDENRWLVGKDVVHQPLERRVLQSKWHEEVLEQPEGGGDGRLGDVGGGDRDLMIPLDQIQFAENLATSQAAVEVLHVGQGVPIWCCDVVEAAVVAAGLPSAVFSSAPCAVGTTRGCQSGG